MVSDSESTCPNCGGKLKHYDDVQRIVKIKGGIKTWIIIRRMICKKCKTIHRELPDSIMPYKHYEAKIIRDFLSGKITSYDIDYEDYPCENTVKLWFHEYRRK